MRSKTKGRVLILGVLAGAYRGGQLERMTRTHAIYNDAPKAFCGYKADGLVDYADPKDAIPSCPRCLEILEGRLKRGVIEAVK
jgi:hypothetical protein